MLDYTALAAKIIARIAIYSDKKGRGCSRLRISARSLRKLTKLPYINDEVFKNLDLALGIQGWSTIRIDDSLGIILSDTINNWPRVAMSDDETDGD